MSNATEGLNTRFHIALQSNSEREFYQNLYYYFDFVLKTPELKIIFEQSEREYSQKHAAIWEKRPMTDAEADEAEAETYKLEGFNLFAVGCAIYVRIYLPIDDYKNTPEPDEDQDPAAVILIKGAEYAKGLAKKKPKNIFKWKNVDIYDRWFRNKRNHYEAQLRHFHLILLDAITQYETAPRSKLQIQFDKETSILTIGDKAVKVTLKNDKPIEHYILEYIFDNKEGLGAKSYYADIIEAKFPQENVNERSFRRACTALNGKVSKQANISNFLIFDSGKRGSVQISPDYL